MWLDLVLILFRSHSENRSSYIRMEWTAVYIYTANTTPVNSYALSNNLIQREHGLSGHLKNVILVH